MVKERDSQIAQRSEEPGERPPLRSRLWERSGFGEKTLWDLLQLLIIPLALAAIGFWFTVEQEEHQREIEAQQAQLEREIEAERAEQVTLQAYLDQMGTLLLDRDLRGADENSDVRRLARSRTLVVLDALGPVRQERALRFLYEAELIQATPPDGQPIITLKYATLADIELPYRHLLRGADLQQADLSGANLAHIDLRDTHLAGAHLEGADLEGADLEDADLSGAFLKGADLSDAILAGVDLSNAEGLWEKGTDMWKRGAGLSQADLSGAHLEGANLSGADLSGTNLKGAHVTSEQLAECESLEGATMPDGTKHP